jgi:hypothetical protein
MLCRLPICIAFYMLYNIVDFIYRNISVFNEIYIGAPLVIKDIFIEFQKTY